MFSNTKILKKSVKINNHRTSISIEKEFWLELVAASKKLNISINKLITIIDEKRFSKSFTTPPIIVNSLLFLISDSAKLYAFK